MRYPFFAIVAAMIAGSALLAQNAIGTPKRMAADASPQFEVATIKPSHSQEAGGAIKVSTGGMVSITNFPVMVLIQFAFNVIRGQISGGPPWLQSESFDVVGKPELEGTPNMSQVRDMLRKLLVDRLQLSIHHEQKESSAYALTVAKGGLKVTEDTDSLSGLPTFVGSGGLQGRSVGNATMAQFANDLQGRLGRPVVDQTGLGPRRYNFILKWTPDVPAINGATGAPPRADTLDAPPDIFAAVQEQLGLKLESTKGQVDVIVIDHVEKPDAN